MCADWKQLNVDDATRKTLDEHEQKNPLKPEQQLEADAPLMAQVRSMVESYSYVPPLDMLLLYVNL